MCSDGQDRRVPSKKLPIWCQTFLLGRTKSPQERELSADRCQYNSWLKGSRKELHKPLAEQNWQRKHQAEAWTDSSVHSQKLLHALDSSFLVGPKSHFICIPHSTNQGPDDFSINSGVPVASRYFLFWILYRQGRLQSPVLTSQTSILKDAPNQTNLQNSTNNHSRLNQSSRGTHSCLSHQRPKTPTSRPVETRKPAPIVPSVCELWEGLSAGMCHFLPGIPEARSYVRLAHHSLLQLASCCHPGSLSSYFPIDLLLLVLGCLFLCVFVLILLLLFLTGSCYLAQAGLDLLEILLLLSPNAGLWLNCVASYLTFNFPLTLFFLHDKKWRKFWHWKDFLESVISSGSNTGPHFLTGYCGCPVLSAAFICYFPAGFCGFYLVETPRHVEKGQLHIPRNIFCLFSSAGWHLNSPTSGLSWSKVSSGSQRPI